METTASNDRSFCSVKQSFVGTLIPYELYTPLSYTVDYENIKVISSFSNKIRNCCIKCSNRYFLHLKWNCSLHLGKDSFSAGPHRCHSSAYWLPQQHWPKKNAQLLHAPLTLAITKFHHIRQTGFTPSGQGTALRFWDDYITFTL